VGMNQLKIENTMNCHEGHVICMDDTVDTLGLFCCDPILYSIVFEGDFEIVIFMNVHAMTFKVDTRMQSY
jgi:tartrate dehydratase alpha subunit/fumarate hydratase class I-like protein